MTCVYLLERKSDYLPSLIKFEEYAKTQYKGKILFIRLDNALELADEACV